MKKFFFWLIIGILFIANTLLADTIKTIRFATEATYPPFEYMSVSGTIRGFDIDLATALCQQIKAQCTFSNQPWDSLIPSLKIGKFDALIGAIGITDARKKQVDFTDSYYQPTGSFVAATNANLSLNKQRLKDKIIGVQGGTTYEQYLQAVYGDIVKINNYASLQDALLDLKAGRVDAVLGDTPTIKDWINKHGSNKYSQVGQPIINSKYFGAGFGIAVQKGNMQLLTALNNALTTIKVNGIYDKIYQKYFGKASATTN